MSLSCSCSISSLKSSAEIKKRCNFHMEPDGLESSGCSSYERLWVLTWLPLKLAHSSYFETVIFVHAVALKTVSDSQKVFWPILLGRVAILKFKAICGCSVSCLRQNDRASEQADQHSWHTSLWGRDASEITSHALIAMSPGGTLISS